MWFANEYEDARQDIRNARLTAERRHNLHHGCQRRVLLEERSSRYIEWRLCKKIMLPASYQACKIIGGGDFGKTWNMKRRHKACMNGEQS
jgi:hypothetical protein